MRLGMVVEYDGTEYAGWQLQPDQPTIQGALERALAIVLGESVRLAAAGRTDAGVHARGQVVAFSTQQTPNLKSLERSLNALAGSGIGVRELRVVRDDFDPRREARRRAYEYRIHNHPWPSPFCRRYAWHVREPLEAEALGRAASLLIGEHDFRSFQAADCDAETSVRCIFRSAIETDGDDVVYSVSATAFLRHMVRNIVGTLVAVGRGERSVEDFGALVEARDRTLAGSTAPAHGLCLVRVEYDGEFA